MDHLIEYIINYMDFDVRQFREEWESGEYRKPKHCPSYPLIQACCDAISALNRMDGGYSGITPESLLEQE